MEYSVGQEGKKKEKREERKDTRGRYEYERNTKYSVREDTLRHSDLLVDETPQSMQAALKLPLKTIVSTEMACKWAGAELSESYHNT